MSSWEIKAKLNMKGINLLALGEEIKATLEEEVSNLAQATYANIMAKAQHELQTTRLDYLKGLEFTKLTQNSYLITLEGKWANDLEAGFSPYNLTERLLASNKIVTVGSRTGLPWVQKSKSGGKYAHVPREHSPFSKTSKNASLDSAIKDLKVINAKGRTQKFTSIFKDPFKNPLQGKVATAKLEGFGSITKFQSLVKNEKTGKTSVKSLYMSWRTVSDKGQPWQHPGFKGLHAFEEAERFIEEEIDKIINALSGV